MGDAGARHPSSRPRRIVVVGSSPYTRPGPSTSQRRPGTGESTVGGSYRVGRVAVVVAVVLAGFAAAPAGAARPASLGNPSGGLASAGGGPAAPSLWVSGPGAHVALNCE